MLGSLLFLATSVMLFNDSPFPLKAEIMGADGSLLGSVQILPQHEVRWQDSAQNVQTFTRTPYTVIWSCTTGDEYGVSSMIPTGATTYAQSSDGRRFCKPQQQQSSSSSQSQ